ncbi:short-chain dehydrogenase [Amycolatopsis sp. A1MSW2902]|uniref:SDR family NAD(P)-dependent oxidoreductase n=1 Tax=Amycolatopsis sp. A1MSW2902 TaxID=687413 RepID=UPI00307DEBB2
MSMTCLVTGGAGGVGEAIVTKLAGRGATVIAVARTVESGRAAAARIERRVPGAAVEFLVADLAALDQVDGLAGEMVARLDRLDALVLNAGVARPRRELTVDGFEVDFATNHLSPFLLVNRLQPVLVASAPARVVVAASTAHQHVKRIDLADLPRGLDFHHIRTYAATKLLNVFLTTELARRLAGTGVTVNAADPCFTRSGLGRDTPWPYGLFLTLARPFQRTPDKAAETAVHVATATELEPVTGRYFRNGKQWRPGRLASDPDLAGRLWTLSTELLSDKALR